MSEYNIQMNKYNALNAEYDQLYPATKIENVDGLNTALQNKPSKSPVHVDDANDVTKSGFYTCKTNIPFGYGLANVLTVGDIDDPNNIFTQIAFGVNLNPVNRNAIAVRCYVPVEGFKDWEWFNPPMELGVEYRTTERYLGKPVYVKAVNFGEGPNSSTKTVAHGVTSIDKSIRVWGNIAHNNLIGYPDVSAVLVGMSEIAIKTSVNLSTVNIVVGMAYTKTTD